jgi:hypothetical protein
MKDRPRGPRTREHLAKRERPSEVVLVVGLFAPFTLLALLIGGFVVMQVLEGTLPRESLWIPLHALGMLVCACGLWRGTRWGWTLGVITLGTFAAGAGVGAAAAALQGGGCSAVFFGVIAGLSGAPLFLLAKARRRYESWASFRREEPLRPEP